MSQNSDRVSEAPAESTTRKVAEAAHKVIDESVDRAENLERQIRYRAELAQEKMTSSQQVAGEQLERSLAQLESFVKERPLAATGIAFAAGVLATALLRR